MNTKNLTPIDEALEYLLQEIQPISASESVGLGSALGRILFNEVKAEIDVPGYDNSAMDGFAINTSALKEMGNKFPISQTITAGKTATPLKYGTAARIFTGAPIPKGADAVVLQENTLFDQETVSILELPKSGENIRLLGHDIKQGALVLPAGRKLQVQDIGLLASIGVSSVAVSKRLTVAIVNTGDELIEPGQYLKPGQIYESNSFTLDALLRTVGIETIKLGIVKDDLEATKEAFKKAAEQADCIITSGGVSVGDADFVKAAVENLGELSLWKLAIKPGKPFSFGHIKGKSFFGLPGNPVAVFVTFLVLVKPCLMKMQGARDLSTPVYNLPAGFQIPEPGFRQEYLRVRLGPSKGEQRLLPYSSQGSSVMSSTSWADGLAIIPIGTIVREGDLIQYLPFNGLL